MSAPWLPSGGRSRALGGHAAVFAAYLVLATVATWPLAAHVSDRVCGFSPEGRMPPATPPLNIWAMAVVLRQIPAGPLQLFEGNAFYPYEHTLAFSEHLFVPALLAAPVALATGNWVLAYNVVLLLTLATAGFGMHLLALELTEDPVAAFGAGILYAFHTWNVNELVRSQITANQWFPLVLLSLVRFFGRPSWRQAALAGVFCVLQSLSCMYWALYLPFVAGGAGLYLWRRHRTPWRKLAPLASALALAAGLTGLFLIPYASTARDLGFERALPPSVPVDRYLDVLPRNLLYSGLLDTALPNQNAAHFLGFLALGLAVLGVATRRGAGPGAARLTPLLLGLAAFGFLMSLGPRVEIAGLDLGPGPWSFFRAWVPGFRNVRYPERASLLLVLALAPLLARGLARLRPLLGRGGLAVLAALVFVEHLSIPQDLYRLPPADQIPSVYHWLAERPEIRVVAEAPTGAYHMERADAFPMYYSTVHWKRTPEGYTSYFPLTYHPMKWRLFHFPRPESVRFLERFGVDAVVVAPVDGARPRWAGPDARWRVHGPFSEGHAVLRLLGAAGLRYGPPEDDEARHEEVSRIGWRAEASRPGAELALDGDDATVWRTGRAQRKGDFLRLSFPRPIEAARIRLEVLSPSHPQALLFPMRFRVLGRPAGTERWASLPVDAEEAFDRFFARTLHRPRDTAFDLDFEPRSLDGLEIRITETDPFWMPWSLPEVRVYRRVEAARP